MPFPFGRRLPFRAVAVVLLSAACGSNSDPSATVSVDRVESAVVGPVGLTTDLEVAIDGRIRVYDVYVPATHWQEATPAAVVVLLHGHRSSRSDLHGGSRRVAPYRAWQAIAETENVLLLVPQGVEGPNGHSGWNDCRADAAGNPETDDVGFVRAALAQLSDTYRVDRERIVAVGTSNGGHMAIRLAQEAPDLVKGIGVIAAGMPANSTCADSDAPVSAVFMWGTDDPLAPYGGGAMTGDRGDILSADASVKYWVNRNRTVVTPAVTVVADTETNDHSTVELDVYAGGEDDSVVALYRIVGGGHTEPSIEHRYRRLFRAVVGEQNHDIEMADEVWNFLDRSR